MGYTREQRTILHTKQGRMSKGLGVPTLNELIEGVPVLRATEEGVVEYVRFNNELYKKVLERV